MADTKDVVKATDDSRGSDRGRGRSTETRQTISRMPDEETFGPFYPSGMSSEEALVAGADADLPDDVRSARDKSAKGKTTKKGDDA